MKREHFPRRTDAARFKIAMLTACLSCMMVQSISAQTLEQWRRMRDIDPKGYVCCFIEKPIVVDGHLDDPAWGDIPWTDPFVDITGDSKLPPRLKTRVKMAWDREYLYIGAEMEDPHVWALSIYHDTLVSEDSDFEIVIDPDGDSHNYFRIAINPIGTVWDQLLTMPYKDSKKECPEINTWDSEGMKAKVFVDGTLNDPKQTDKGWSVEYAIPWLSLSNKDTGPCPPRHNDQMRINFLRRYYEPEIITARNSGSMEKDNAYRRKLDIPVKQWVWSPQGIDDIHRPEMWGYIQFSTDKPGKTPFHPDPTIPGRKILQTIYYAEYDYYNRQDYYKNNQRYINNLDELKADIGSLDGIVARPVLEASTNMFNASAGVKMPDGTIRWLRIHQDALITMYADGK